MFDIQHIKDLLSKGEVGQVLDLLRQLSKDEASVNSRIILLSAQNYQSQKDFELGLLNQDDYKRGLAKITYALTQMIERGDFDSLLSQKSQQADRLGPQKDVFISYSHRDMDIAQRIKKRLEAADISIEIDEYGMNPGIDVYAYIRQAVKHSRFTLSVVSEHSLLSTWVVMETLGTFQLEQFQADHKLIPCYIDKSFMERDFVLKAVRHIDKEIADLDSTIKQQNALNLDSRNFNEEKTRYYHLRNNIDNIIGRLKRSKCVNITEAHFEEGMTQVVNTILS